MTDDKGGVFISAPFALHVAQQAYRAMDDGTPHKKPRDFSEPMTALVFSAIAVEAFLNELAEFAAGAGGVRGTDHPALKALADTQAEAERSRGSLRLKFQLAAISLGGSPFEKGTPPYQDFDLLVSLRDALVHPKPVKVFFEDAGVRMQPDSLIKALAGRGLLPKADPRIGMPFHAWISPRAVSRWAINTAVACVLAVVEMLPSTLGKNDPPLLVRTDPPIILGARQALAPHFPLRP